MTSMATTRPELPHFDRLSLDHNARTDLDLPSRPSLSPLQRPETPRRCTDPASPASPPPTTHPQPKPHNASLYPRGHLRSQSANNVPTAHSMARTRSMPSVPPPSIFSRSPSTSPVRPSSPFRPPPTSRPGSRRSFDEAYPNQQQSVPSFMDIESIAEDSELDLTPKNIPPRDLQSSPGPIAFHSNTFPRSNSSRRRPTSPLQHSSPSSLHSAKFNEPFPAYPPTFNPAMSATSSNPSTPTSFRSRSPSISSLETIPDSPDAEEAAIESFHIARLKAAVDAAEAAESQAETEKKMRAVGLQVPAARPGASSWGNLSVKDKRKRWSVCGAERRGDFEMETIWED